MEAGHEGKRNLSNRLRRIEGQVRGVQRMVREDAPCVDILTQLASILAASEKVALLILKGHIDHRVREALDEHLEPGETVDDLLAAVDRFRGV